jgi:AdoMet-dependent rRNA methyltransferase SPB1
LPVTKDEVLKQKQRLMEVNARPIKKVLEAEFRKKRKIKNKLEKIREKANSIAENNEISNHEKAKILQKLYKDTGKKKEKKVYVVGKKFSPTISGKRKRGALIMNVDKRLKKDKRSKKSKDKK